MFAVQQIRFLLAEPVICLRCLSGHWHQKGPPAHIEFEKEKKPKDRDGFDAVTAFLFVMGIGMIALYFWAMR